MIRLKSIEIHNFRSFASTPKIEFPKSGLVLLNALPFNGSTSGIGKTNFLKAICYGATTGLIRDNTKHWFSSEQERLSVAEELVVDDKVYRISRGSFKTELSIDGIKQEGGAKASNDNLRKIFGLDFDLIELLTVRRQRKQNSFVASTDSEKKEFLSRILGLELIDELIKVSNETIKKIEILVEQERLAIQGFTAELAALVKPPSINNNEIEYLTIQLNRNVDLLNKATAELDLKEHAKESLEQLKLNRLAKLPNTEELKKAAKDDFIAEAIPLNQILLEKTQRRDKLAEDCSPKGSLIEQNLNLTIRLLSLEESLCSECQRPWEEALAEAEKCKDKLASNQSRLKEIGELEQELKTYQNAIKSVETLIADRKRISDEELAKLDLDFKSRKSLIDTEYATQIGDLHIEIIKDGISDLNKVISDINLKIKELENQNNIYEFKLKAYVDKFDDLNSKIKKAHTNIKKMMDGMALEEDFKDLIGRKGFLGLIVAEILLEISFNVNQILSQIPNTSEVSVQICPTQEKENSVKPKISFLIYKRGMEVDLNGLSDGQQVALELAMDIALSKVIFRRLNVSFGWSIFDESFHGLSSADKEAYFEILKKEAEDKLILIVDHDDKFANYFDKVLTLRYDGQQTTVQE